MRPHSPGICAAGATLIAKMGTTELANWVASVIPGTRMRLVVMASTRTIRGAIRFEAQFLPQPDLSLTEDSLRR